MTMLEIICRRDDYFLCIYSNCMIYCLIRKEDELLEDLWDLLVTRRISRYRVDILGGATSFRFRCSWYKRYMPACMVHHRFCNNWLNCPGDGRRPGNFRGYFPADDDEYILNDFCIRCRFAPDVES